MRGLVWSVVAVLLMNSCKNINKVNDSIGVAADSSGLAAIDDSLAEIGIGQEERIPLTVDESFTDFIYSFTRDAKMQKSRIIFPLICRDAVRKSFIDKNEWEFDPIFSRMEVYTIIRNENADAGVEKDTTATNAQVEWILLKKREIKRYSFERTKGGWMLHAIDFVNLAERDSIADGEEFYNFYSRFANDSAFQAARVADPLKYVTFDPDDEFSVWETTLDAGQWFAFSPPIPKDTLTNVIYGRPEPAESNLRIMELKGNGNGFDNTFYFKRRKGRWKLVEFDDLSD